VHTASRTDDEDRPFARTIDDDPSVSFGGDVRCRRDENFFDWQSFDLQLQNLACETARLLGRASELHAARFTTATGVHLRFDYHRSAKFPRNGLGFLWRSRDLAWWNRNAVLAKYFFCLVLVNVHSCSGI